LAKPPKTKLDSSIQALLQILSDFML